jgi:hypothetical protein
LLPCFCLARQAVIGRDGMAWLFALAAIGAGTAGIKSLLGTDLASVALWYGNVTGCTVLLLAGCLGLVLRQRLRSAAWAAPRPYRMIATPFQIKTVRTRTGRTRKPTTRQPIPPKAERPALEPATTSGSPAGTNRVPS